MCIKQPASAQKITLLTLTIESSPLTIKAYGSAFIVLRWL